MVLDLDIISEEISEHLLEMGLIWNAIKHQFQLLLLNLIVKSAIDMGFLDIEREKLMEGVVQSKMLLQSKEGKLLKESLLNNAKINVNLNILSSIDED